MHAHIHTANWHKEKKNLHTSFDTTPGDEA